MQTDWYLFNHFPRFGLLKTFILWTFLYKSGIHICARFFLRQYVGVNFLIHRVQIYSTLLAIAEQIFTPNGCTIYILTRSQCEFLLLHVLDGTSYCQVFKKFLHLKYVEYDILLQFYFTFPLLILNSFVHLQAIHIFCEMPVHIFWLFLYRIICHFLTDL